LATQDRLQAFGVATFPRFNQCVKGKTSENQRFLKANIAKNWRQLNTTAGPDEISKALK
jgi:hypothetical protein